MNGIYHFKHEEIFRYFEEISKIPRGSGNMKKISDYCVNFASKHCLKVFRDEADNVIIYKDATKGYETSEPIILQGHLDMVCQKEEDCDIDFENDGIDIYADGDYIKAKGTTLGADNGIAVAMILAVLASNEFAHPPIEAVFTTDEEIGMIGALALHFDKLKGRKMINIDSENAEVITVSCAGGSDFMIDVPLERSNAKGSCISLTVKGLKGGHSGVEINSGRVNANLLMGRILNHLYKKCAFEIVSVDGGEKGNAIPEACTATILTSDDSVVSEIEAYVALIKKEIYERESEFCLEVKNEGKRELEVITLPTADKLIYLLICAPNGVVEMSMEIENLVETSLNLGILKTTESKMMLQFALRSNKQSALDFLEEKLCTYSQCVNSKVETCGQYPPWEYNENSTMQSMYAALFEEKFGYAPKIKAIHAGLECGVFASAIKNFDCISIGPDMEDIHTTKERLSISSSNDVFELVVELLAKCK